MSENQEVHATQDPKYVIVEGQLANVQTGEYIPSNEPIFIFRAKDIHAVGILKKYEDTCLDQEHRANIMARIAEFEAFAADNNDLMGEPDTLVSDDLEANCGGGDTEGDGQPNPEADADTSGEENSGDEKPEDDNPGA